MEHDKTNSLEKPILTKESACMRRDKDVKWSMCKYGQVEESLPHGRHVAGRVKIKQTLEILLQS